MIFTKQESKQFSWGKSRVVAEPGEVVIFVRQLNWRERLK